MSSHNGTHNYYASVGGATRHTVIALSVVHSFCLSVCLLYNFCSARWTVSSETSNASRTRHYLAFEHVKIVYEASFSSYGVICLLCLPLLAIWTSPKANLSTVDCLEADRFEFYYRIAAQVQRNRVSKLRKLSRSWYAEHCRHAQLNCGQHWLASDCITKALLYRNPVYMHLQLLCL